MRTEGNTFSVLPGTPGSIVAALLAKDNRRRLATFARRAHTFFCEATFSEADAPVRPGAPAISRPAPAARSPLLPTYND